MPDLCRSVLGRWTALFPPPSGADRAGQDNIKGSWRFTSIACILYISQPTDTPEPGNPQRTSGNPSRWPLAGLASKSSLPCPGEEAPPRPKSLVGVGTWGLQVIALGPRRRPWAAVPSAARGDTALPASGSGGRGGDQRSRSHHDKTRGARRPLAQGCGCPTTAARGDRLPAC